MFARDFWLYLLARFFTATALTMLRAAIAWHVFEISRSAFHLGLIGLVQFIPAFTFSLIAGAVADTYERRKVLVLTQLISIACALTLLVATLQDFALLGVLYVVVFVASIGSSFDAPARAAMLPALVERDYFPRAVIFATTNQALAFVTGPAVCGLIIATAGIWAVYGTLLLFGVGSLISIGLIRPVWPTERRSAVSFAAIREGLAFVRRRQVILGCMTLDMFAVVFGSATALLPIYATEILHVGPRGYGLLTSSLEIGALLMSFALMVLPPIQHAGRVLLITITVYGIATIVFGLSRSFPLSLAAYMIAGMADQVSVVMRHTIIQLTTPDELRGRVSSVNMIFIGASNQLGAVESGFVAALTTAPFAVVSGGAACLLAVATIGAAMPQLRRYRIGEAIEAN